MIRELQDAVDVWHRDRYPTATAKDVALKLAEEAGEVCGAVVEVDHPPMNGTRDARALADELGDVVIAATALAARAGIDLQGAVAGRWVTVSSRVRSSP